MVQCVEQVIRQLSSSFGVRIIRVNYASNNNTYAIRGIDGEN